jgi:D-glycero-alpha-D-manno-heptose-7-phosphate kinase
MNLGRSPRVLVARRAIRVIHSVAPIRICDNGGWTDTWFAQHGKVFNIGVHPCVEVQLQVLPYQAGQDRIILYAENYDQRYVVRPRSSASAPVGWGAHPLLEAAIERVGVPADYAIEVTVYSAMPGGGSTGTSAAVTVALIGALNHLGSRQWSPHEIAYQAHAVEVEMLQQQSGVQDQLCAAYGGINYIEIPRYPEAVVFPIQVPESTWWELERRLVLVYLGQAHDSSEVHQKVIAELENEGPDSKRLQDLRLTAEKSRDAIITGDFSALGRAMIENTEAQGRLHPHLISRDARQVIDIAKEFGAFGWKVNGAGGEGGSVTILCPELSHVKRDMMHAIEGANALFENIPIHLTRHGLRVWEYVHQSGPK